MKSDGFPTYHLANVVDDHLMRITDVIRAEEWISSTPKHVLLYQAFGWDLPKFWHMPLLRNIDKSKISKRKNPVSLIFYRQSGFLPEAMLNFLGLMGGGMPQTSGTIEDKSKAATADLFNLDQMIDRFAFDKISLGGPVFDLVKLKCSTASTSAPSPPRPFTSASARPSSPTPSSSSSSPSSRPASKPSARSATSPTSSSPTPSPHPSPSSSPRSAPWTRLSPSPPDLLTVLEATPWTVDQIEAAMKQLGTEKEWSVKENFMLLRAILTGKTSSPPLLESLIVFGKARSLDRLRRFLDTQKKLSTQRK